MRPALVSLLLLFGALSFVSIVLLVVAVRPRSTGYEGLTTEQDAVEYTRDLRLAAVHIEPSPLSRPSATSYRRPTATPGYQPRHAAVPSTVTREFTRITEHEWPDGVPAKAWSRTRAPATVGGGR